MKLCACVLLVATALSARADLSLPLGPYYRPGRYIPVRVTLDSDKPTDVTLSAAQGAVATRIRSATRVDAIVPLLVLDSRAKRLTLDGQPASHVDLEPLADTDRLVAWTTPDEPFARQITGAARIIPITLDPVQLLAGHPAAWEMLDAVLLDSTSGGRFTERHLAVLVAAGVTVAIKTDAPPYPDWPWVRVGGYWVLVHPPAGPAIAPFRDDVYAPVADWEPGLPADTRRRILLAAALACIALLAVAVWRPRRTPLYAAVALVAIAVLLHYWGRRQLSARQAAGEILVIDRPYTQTDTWVYQTAPADCQTTVAWQDCTRPVYASRASLDDIRVVLNCNTDGVPTHFGVHLPAYRKLAFLTRSLYARTPRGAPALPVTSPLRALAEELYLVPGARLTGELPAPDDRSWRPVVIQRTR